MSRETRVKALVSQGYTESAATRYIEGRMKFRQPSLRYRIKRRLTAEKIGNPFHDVLGRFSSSGAAGHVDHSRSHTQQAKEFIKEAENQVHQVAGNGRSGKAPSHMVDDQLVSAHLAASDELDRLRREAKEDGAGGKELAAYDESSNEHLGASEEASKRIESVGGVSSHKVDEAMRRAHAERETGDDFIGHGTARIDKNDPSTTNVTFPNDSQMRENRNRLGAAQMEAFHTAAQNAGGNHSIEGPIRSDENGNPVGRGSSASSHVTYKIHWK